jgi:hypothetical protein
VVRFTCVLAAVAVLALTGLAFAEAAVNQQAIQDVAAGKIKVAKASWWGYDPMEATACLQAAINSRVPKLIVDNVGSPWVVDPISLVSNQEVFFEAGVEVVAKKGSFQGTGDSLFTAANVENLIFHGDPRAPAILRMHRSDYAAPPYKKGEWRMVLELDSTTNVLVSDLILRDSGGDGIYLGVGTGFVPNKNVTIRNVVCDSNYRQGISVICAEDLLIENCQLINTGGTAPMAGIDFEPNRPGERLVNCVMRNCITRGNASTGYALYLPPLTAESLPISLRFENCRSIDDGGAGVAIYTGNDEAKAVRGSIEFVNCEFRRPKRAGIVIADKPAAGAAVTFRNCAVVGAALHQPLESPVMLIVRGEASQAIGGIAFDNLRIRDYRERTPITLSDNSGMAQLEDVTGRVVLEQNRKRTAYDLTPDLLARWIPIEKVKVVPRVPLKGLSLGPIQPLSGRDFGMPSVYLRGPGEYAVWSAVGETVKLKLTFRQVGRYAGTTMPVTVLSPSGGKVASAQVPFGGESEVSFQAPETGLYRVSVDAGQNKSAVTHCDHPLLLPADGSPISLIGPAGQLYFYVPAGTSEFALRTHGEGTAEGVHGTLLDPAGRVVEDLDNITRLHQFLVTLSAPSGGEVWSIRLTTPTAMVCEDHSLSVLGIPPLVAGSPVALLVPTGR